METETAPPTLKEKLLDLSHIKTIYGKLQIVHTLSSVTTLLSGIITTSVNTLPRETQVVPLTVFFAIVAIFDFFWLATFHFKIDQAFQFFQDRPLLIQRMRVLLPLFFGLCGLFSVVATTPLGFASVSITMFLGFCASVAHLFQPTWILEAKDEALMMRNTYMKSEDPLPDVFENDDSDFPPPHSVKISSRSEFSLVSNSSKSPNGEDKGKEEDD